MPGNDKISLLRQALASAEDSLKTAKQLLSELERGGARIDKPAPQKKELPGISGIFDGEQMVAESGEKYPVPENYASKSLLIVGDTLKLVEEGGEKRFKQVEHVKRHKSQGILAKKDGKWRVVTPEGSYKVLPSAVSHFNGEVGDEVNLHIPAGNLSAPYGAIESINNKNKTEPVEQERVVEQPKIEQNKNTQNTAKQKPQQAKKPGNKKHEVAKKEEKPKVVENPKKEVEYREVEVVPEAAKVKLPSAPVQKVDDEDELT